MYRLIAFTGVLCCVLNSGAAGLDPLRVVVGIPSGLPGYDLLPNGELYIADPYKQRFTDCVSKGLNTKFEWKALPTKRAIQMLIANEVDMIYPMGFTEERASQMLQSRPAWKNPDFLVSLRPVNMADSHLRIAARLGSPQQTDYASEGYTNVITVYAYEDLAKLLVLDNVDVVIVPKSVYHEQKSIWPAGVVAVVGKERNSGFYVNLGDPMKLITRLNMKIKQCQKVLVAK
jgi:hypothetical protein